MTPPIEHINFIRGVSRAWEVMVMIPGLGSCFVASELFFIAPLVRSTHYHGILKEMPCFAHLTSPTVSWWKVCLRLIPFYALLNSATKNLLKDKNNRTQPLIADRVEDVEMSSSAISAQSPPFLSQEQDHQLPIVPPPPIPQSNAVEALPLPPSIILPLPKADECLIAKSRDEFLAALDTARWSSTKKRFTEARAPALTPQLPLYAANRLQIDKPMIEKLQVKREVTELAIKELFGWLEKAGASQQQLDSSLGKLWQQQIDHPCKRLYQHENIQRKLPLLINAWSKIELPSKKEALVQELLETMQKGQYEQILWISAQFDQLEPSLGRLFEKILEEKTEQIFTKALKKPIIEIAKELSKRESPKASDRLSDRTDLKKILFQEGMAELKKIYPRCSIPYTASPLMPTEYRYWQAELRPRWKPFLTSIKIQSLLNKVLKESVIELTNRINAAEGGAITAAKLFQSWKEKAIEAEEQDGFGILRKEAMPLYRYPIKATHDQLAGKSPYVCDEEVGLALIKIGVLGLNPAVY